MKTSLLIFVLGIAAPIRSHSISQVPLRADISHTGPSDELDHPGCLPRINYHEPPENDTLIGDLSEEMILHHLHISGPWTDRVDLTFFSDGYTISEQHKFLEDAKKLTADIVSPGGPMSDVAHLLNVFGVFVPSEKSGIGSHDIPLNGSAFGLYRPGPELRGVYVNHPKRARAACRYWRERGRGGHEGGCDQPILLGNDPLYGGLGGEFTIITASELNGPLVLRHELGHSLIEVGEEYEGGYVYSGVNSDKVKNLHNLKWKRQLSEPDSERIEDVQVPLQAYPWHNLSIEPYSIKFNSSSTSTKRNYPSALLRMSLSSIPYPDHIEFLLNGLPLNLSTAFLGGKWARSKDRRWVEIELPNGIPDGTNQVEVALTSIGAKEPAGQGGKMMTSVEIIEYGPNERCNRTEGFVGAFPTYAMDGGVTLRPMNEECIMRRVTHPTFCPVCKKGLEDALHRRIVKKQNEHK